MKRKHNRPATRPDQGRVDPETGLTYAEIERESRRRLSVVEANTDPLPGSLAQAFPARCIRVGSFAVRPVVGVDMVILRHLDSPLLRQMAEARKPVEDRQQTQFTDQDGWEMALQFLADPARVEAEVSRGREHFAALARDLVGLRMNPIIIGMIVDAVAEQFRSCFATAVQFAANTQGDAEASPFFTKPPAYPTTAPAGGCSTSASSCATTPK
jgi:hypothetical protein